MDNKTIVLIEKYFIYILICIAVVFFLIKINKVENVKTKKVKQKYITTELVKDMPLNKEPNYKVYAGRFEKANNKTLYNLDGLPVNRNPLWLSQSEWKGYHIENKLIKNRFKKWKTEYQKQWTKHMLLEAVKESKVFPDIPPSLYVAQMILESNYGLSKLASEGNLFGHKWRGQKDGYITLADDSPTDKFRTFKNGSKWESLRAHSYLLMGMYRKRIKGKPNLKKWLVALCGSMSAQESKKFVKAGGMVYATSCMTETCYAQKLKNIIKRNNLDRYDKK